MTIARPSLARALRTSAALHLGGALLLLIWGAQAPRSQIDTGLDVVMIEVSKGESETIGLGTTAAITESQEKTIEPEAADVLPTWQARTTPIMPESPDVMPVPQEKENPPKTTAKAPEQQKANQAASTPAPKKTQTTTAAAPKRRSESHSLKSTLQNLKNGPTGQRESQGWKKGTANKPAAQASSSAIMSRYKAQVRSKILGQWAAPGHLKKLPPAKRPKAVVHVSVSASGSITRSNWVKKSGNSNMDESVMRAVRRSSPVAAPPADIKSKVLSEGLTLTFKP